MKAIRILMVLVLTGISVIAEANRDSVGVFVSKEKMNILINERGHNQRLQQFMDAMKWGENTYWVNHDETIKIHCAREEAKAVCVFTLKPSEFVKFDGKSAQARFQENSFNAAPYEMTFASSMEDKFLIQVNGTEVHIWAAKKNHPAPF